MTDVENYDVLIIGGGKAGKTLAADLGRSNNCIALVERGMIGGTCINVGCIPSKTLVRSAKVAALTARSAEFGVTTTGRGIDMRAVRERKRAVVADMVDVNWDNLHGALGDRFILGDAKFVGLRTVEVRPALGGPTRRLYGKKLFVNLGAKPSIPAIPGLAEVQPLTSESALELDRVPEHLLILGGGYIGVELGQVFRRFGSRVTIIQKNAHLLPSEDPDVSEAVESLFWDDGIGMLLNAEVIGAEKTAEPGVRLRVRLPDRQRTVDVSGLIVAVGRTPNTRGIGLESAGIDLNSRGFIKVNDRLETSAPDTWAMGDSAGSPQQTHVALDDYRIVKANVFERGNRTTSDRLIPHTVFIDPELGRVGLSENEARDRGLRIRVVSIPTSAVPRAATMSEKRGFLKAVVSADSDQILGFTMFGPEAGEVTAVVQMAMLGRVPFTAVRDAVLAHPTMAEGLNYLFKGLPSVAGEGRTFP